MGKTMTNPIKTLAERLVLNGYATDMKPIPYGLTKQTAYEVFVEGEGWQTVNPFGYDTYCAAQHRAVKLRNILTVFITYLDEDQLLHFRKICKPISEMNAEQLDRAIGLVERTLTGKGLYPDGIVEDFLDSINIDK